MFGLFSMRQPADGFVCVAMRVKRERRKLEIVRVNKYLSRDDGTFTFACPFSFLGPSDVVQVSVIPPLAKLGIGQGDAVLSFILEASVFPVSA